MANTNAKKISQYTACTIVKSSDLLIVDSYDSSTNTYITKQATANALFSNVSSLVVTTTITPSNSASSHSVANGTIWADTNYIYVKTSNTEVKRVALSTF